MPTNAACPNDVAPPTPVSITRPSTTSALMPTSLSSETPNLPSSTGAIASAAASASTSQRCTVHRLAIDLLLLLFGVALQRRAQQQHRDQQAEDDHVLQRTAPERAEALDHADRERTDRRQWIADEPADDRGDERLQPDQEPRVVVHRRDRRDQHADQTGQQRREGVR